MATEAFDAVVYAMSETLKFSPVPTMLLSPSHHAQWVSEGVLKAWGRREDEVVGKALFIALYQGSLTEKFDRIPLTYAIETTIAARKTRLCHNSYAMNSISWNARIIPFHKATSLCVYCWSGRKPYLT